MNVGVSLNIDELDSDHTSSPNTVFIDAELRQSQSLHLNLGNLRKNKNKNDGMSIYGPKQLPMKHSQSMDNSKDKNSKLGMQQRHSIKKIMDAKEYEYRFDNGGGKGKIMSSKFRFNKKKSKLKSKSKSSEQHKSSFDLHKPYQRRSLHLPQIRKYRNKLQEQEDNNPGTKNKYRHRHTIVNTLNRQQYAKRKLKLEQKNEQKEKRKRR